MIVDIRASNTAENLRRLIGESKKSLRQLESETGVPYKTIHNLTSGRNEPSYAVVLRLADFFDVSLDDLMREPDARPRRKRA